MTRLGSVTLGAQPFKFRFSEELMHYKVNGMAADKRLLPCR
jgi:hypothetical protein